MARTVNIGGTLDDFGTLIRAAFGLDRSWTERAACRDYPIGQRTDGKTPWHVDWGDRLNGVSGREIVKTALIICHGCAAQYDCARYAVEGLCCAGTWAMPLSSLEWLQRQPDALGMIDKAERQGVPVQIAVLDRMRS